MNSNAEHDAIVIGAGIGGLTCGTLLAKHGLKTLLLEQHSLVGGYVTSWTRRGFTFDSIEVIGGLDVRGPIGSAFSEMGVSNRIELLPLEKFATFIYPDTTLNCHVDLNRFEQELADRFPRESRGIREYIRTLKVMWSEFLSLRWGAGFFNRLMLPFRTPTLFRYRNATYGEFLDAFFRDGQLKEILGSLWIYLGLPSSRASAVYWAAVLMSYHATGAWIPRGGYQRVSDACAAAFKQFGGELRLSTGVDQIIVERGKAAGVRLASGEVIRSRSVISNADTKRTFLNLVGREHLPRAFMKRLEGLEISLSAFQVRMGTDVAMPKGLSAGSLMYFPKYGVTEHMFSMARKGAIEDNPKEIFFDMTIPTLVDPGLAPAGCHIVCLSYAPMPDNLRRGMTRHTPEYEAFKERMASILIEAAEPLIPGLDSHILIKDTASPLTFERYTQATDGCLFDAACTPQQSNFRRLPPRTPISGLYLTGAKSCPGHGVCGAVAAGVLTADAVLNGRLTNGRVLLPHHAAART